MAAIRCSAEKELKRWFVSLAKVVGIEACLLFLWQKIPVSQEMDYYSMRLVNFIQIMAFEIGDTSYSELALGGSYPCYLLSKRDNP